MKKWQTAVTALCVVLLIYVASYVALRAAYPGGVWPVLTLHAPGEVASGEVMEISGAVIVDSGDILPSHGGDVYILPSSPSSKTFPKLPLKGNQILNWLFSPARFVDGKVTREQWFF